ncbi:MAG: ABC transporter ATP-binding protein/permease [Lachnospiraceae bacterium]|nr:ABC transporter ATP-binding protein/permease [Lachnospiraceae bacterium]
MKNNDNKNIKTHPVRYFASAMRKYKKGFYPLYAILVTMTVIQPFINIFGPRMMIDEIMGNTDLTVIIRIAAVMVFADFTIKVVTGILYLELDKVFYQGLNRFLEAGVGKKSMELKYETTENKETLDRLSDARTGIDESYSGGSKGMFESLAGIISSIAVLSISVVLVLKYTWIPIVIVVVNVCLNAFFESRLSGIKMEQISLLAKNDRAYFYLLHNLSDIKYGKDIRLFGAGKMMLGRVDEFNDRQSEISRTHAKRAQVYVTGSKINLAVTASLTYLILAVMVIDRKISIGDFTMLSTAVTTIVSSINTVLKALLELKKFCGYTDKYIRYVEGNEYEEKGSKAVDSSDGIVIEYKNVSFRYPGSSSFALKNISAVIKNGERLSVVGLNGAGKTTFIKLLCRLYEPTEGEILLNGVNIHDYDYGSYMKQLSVVFQDFCLLGFSIKENLICDRPDKVQDSELMPLVERVGLKDKVDSLPMGLMTPVFRYYDQSGFEPSGGEQQKIAMARALYKDGPVLILDEPTAALDPVAEKEIYEQFNSMVRNKTAIFISHRLASCRFCDRLLVFKDGEIVERGTHDSLLAVPNGLYAQMYGSQEKMYC